MKYVIWGTGFYCCEKIDNFDDSNIVAFVDRDRHFFHGKYTILPYEIKNYDYDYVAVLSGHYKEIIREMVDMGIDYNKIIPGINFRPFLMSELEYMSNKSKVIVTPEGELEYIYDNKSITKIGNQDSWKQIRGLICDERNAGMIRKMDVRPVGKIYGSDRGGSICRYYLDEFLSMYRGDIRGRVLEIGDRNYTEKYGEGVKESYVLHFQKDYMQDEFDFSGDLRNGEGIKKNFYDCIILTQVLSFVENITYTPDILISSLKIGGKLLINVSGISPIIRHDMDRYGHYWSFTDKSIKNMFSRNNTECKVWTKGNCKVACAFLNGMGYKELTECELQEIDEDFQVAIFAVVTRIG